MKITAISDLHGNLIDIEPCDVLCICGDISPLDIQRDYIQMTKWIFYEFQEWIANLPCDRVILVPGNHDFWFSLFIKQPTTYLFDKLTILIDGESSIYFDEIRKYIKFYGTPYCKNWGNWAFMKPIKELEPIYAKIPEDTDILLTHDAPFQMNNVGLCGYQDIGNVALTEAIKRVKPKYVFCGHIHDGNHTLSKIEIDENKEITKIANVSLLNDNYAIAYKPITIMLKKYCTICNKFVDESEEFCPDCGFDLILKDQFDEDCETIQEDTVEIPEELIPTLGNIEPEDIISADEITDEQLDQLIETIQEYEAEKEEQLDMKEELNDDTVVDQEALEEAA